MKAIDTLIPAELELIDQLVIHYKVNLFGRSRRLANALLELVNDSALISSIHSMKARPKDPEHLRDKLARKLAKCKKDGVAFDINSENLPEKINDLAGFRILHLHTSQFPAINNALMELLAKEEYEVREGPVARTWDDEYKGIFESYGVATEPNPRLYTSVHYVVGSGKKSPITAEIQVRTLAEELWGEVDHAVNYPHPTDIKTCQEQIKVLARVTSSCTRLVDSIFVAQKDAPAN